MLGYEISSSERSLIYILTLGVIPPYRNSGIGITLTFTFLHQDELHEVANVSGFLCCSIGVVVGSDRICQPNVEYQSSVSACHSLQSPGYYVLPEEYVSVHTQASQLLFH